MIELNRQQQEAIREYGVSAYPYECCGLLIGRLTAEGHKIVSEILPVENAREAAAQHNRSLIQPQDLLRGERYARTQKLEVVGNYHSHPDHPAIPSQFDLDHAWPTWSYIIVSVREGQAREVRSWELETDRSRFNEEAMTETDI